MKSKRAWAKWALIGFFAVMGILTFFSGTIRNASLPLVTVQTVSAGTVTPTITGFGTVEAGRSTPLTADRGGTVLEIRVEEGDEVRAGQVLFVVRQEDDGSADALQSQLRQLRETYAASTLAASVPEDSAAWAEYQILANNLEAARARLVRNGEYLEKRASLEARRQAAVSALADAEAAYHRTVDGPAAELDAANRALDAALRQQENARTNADYYTANAPDSDQAQAAQLALAEADALVLDCQNRCYAAQVALDAATAQAGPPLDAAREAEQALSDALTALAAEYAGCTVTVDCENAVLSAQGAIGSFYDRQTAAQVREDQDAAQLASLAEQIAALEQEIADAEAATGDRELFAPSDGVVSELWQADRFDAGASLALIQSTAGCRLRLRVNVTQAAMVRPGMETRIQGQQSAGISVQLLRVEPTGDPEGFQLVFSVDGALPGEVLSLLLAAESTRHEAVVPLAALREDTAGSYVFAVDVQNSAFGTRAKVRRVDVEVLRRDHRVAAVSGELTQGDSVVLLSNQPLTHGQGVRFD